MAHQDAKKELNQVSMGGNGAQETESFILLHGVFLSLLFFLSARRSKSEVYPIYKVCGAGVYGRPFPLLIIASLCIARFIYILPGRGRAKQLLRKAGGVMAERILTVGLDITAEGVNVAIYEDGEPIEVYRPLSLAEAVMVVDAAILGFQRPRDLLYRDKRAAQTLPEQASEGCDA